MLSIEQKINNILKQAKKLQSGKVVKRILERNPSTPDGSRLFDFVIEKNQDQLYNDGTTYEGKKLITDKASMQRKPGAKTYNNVYAWKTIQNKKQEGKRTENVTLNDTGEMYDSMKVKFYTDGMMIDANFNKDGEDIAYNFLFWGGEPFKNQVLYFTDEAENVINDIIKAQFSTELKKDLGL